MKEFTPIPINLEETKNNFTELKTEILTIGGWEIKVLPEPRIFTPKNIQDSILLINDWVTAFPKEETFVQKELSIPSLIIRLDCSIKGEQLGVYEVEERPAGIGLTTFINPDFKNRLEKIKNTWPDFKSVISNDPRRKATDDYLWLNAYDPNNKKDLVLVRAEPEETEYHVFEERSISSLKKKGDKSYGEKIGLWKKVSDPKDIDFENGCVIKPLQGSKTRDVFIYVPGPNSKRPPGASSKGRIEQAIFDASENGGVYCQSYFPPMESEISDDYKWMIYRVFFGYNTYNKTWECLGGSWNARYNLKIHGAGDSLSGPVVVYENNNR